MTKPHLTFRPIDFGRHGDLCVRFRADATACGDGNADAFFATAGPEGGDYITALRAYHADLPEGCVHVWLGQLVIGQIELMRDRFDPQAGKLNLLYLVPECRRRGLGQLLEKYAADLFADIGCRRMWLRVATANAGAAAFYAKHGWADCGPDRREVNMTVMRKTLLPEAV